MPPKKNTVAPKDDDLTSINEDRARSSSARSYDEDHPDAPKIQHEKIDVHDFQNYAVNTLKLEDARIEELDIEPIAVKAKSMWTKTAEIPRWLLLILSNAFILLLVVTFCIVFVNRQARVSYGGSCSTNSDCSSNLDLKCTAGTCSCSTIQYWDNTRCAPQRTFNRSCSAQNQCSSLSKLLCMSVTIGSNTDTLCWCSSYRYWTGDQCSNLRSFNNTCTTNGECDINNFLTCMNGRCNCNSTQFWNNQYCENKRLYGGQCFSTYWCNNATGGLQCATSGSTTGTCDCYTNQYWWSGNNTCLAQLPMNATCTFSYQCSTNLSLSCSSNTNPTSCQCADRYWFNSTKCAPQFLANSSCTSSLQCDDSLSLTCNLTAQRCTCNESDYIWDGSQCVIRRSIGGACSSNAQCLSYQNLICATSGVWNGTCACPTNYYWNTTTSLCVIKKLWNYTCATSYECYDGGYLSCQPSASRNTTICDCGNYTYYWTGFLNNTYGGYCTPKIDYGVPSFTCVSTYQCRDYNYVSCISGLCTCNTYQYWDGVLCEPRLNYSYPCNSTTMCRNWVGGPNLQCLTPLTGGSQKQCLCTSTQYFDYCADYCYTAKSWQQACNISSCYATPMCDQSRSLSCINNICNCTDTQWWNATSCVAKGTYLASCTTGQNFQCQQYNLLSCVGSQCQCSSLYYWSSSSNFCLPKKSINGTCTSTNECLTAAGVGLSCISGYCKCSTGYQWNSLVQQCDPVG